MSAAMPARPGPFPRVESPADEAVAEVVRLLPAIAELPLETRVDAYEKAARVLAQRLEDDEA